MTTINKISSIFKKRTITIDNKTLTNILYVLDLKKIMIFVEKITNVRFNSTFLYNSCIIYNQLTSSHLLYVLYKNQIIACVDFIAKH